MNYYVLHIIPTNKNIINYIPFVLYQSQCLIHIYVRRAIQYYPRFLQTILFFQISGFNKSPRLAWRHMSLRIILNHCTDRLCSPSAVIFLMKYFRYVTKVNMVYK